jgi:hypothetical protein
MCFAVYGPDEVISNFIDYLKTSAGGLLDIRFIAGRDEKGRIKIAITGNTIEPQSIEVFMHQYIDSFYSG